MRAMIPAAMLAMALLFGSPAATVTAAGQGMGNGGGEDEQPPPGQDDGFPCIPASEDRATALAVVHQFIRSQSDGGETPSPEVAYGPIKDWCFDEPNLEYLFSTRSSFNEDISGWDVSKVTNMLGMFLLAEEFDQDISGWDVSKVTLVHRMFHDAAKFNQNLCDWSTKLPSNAVASEMFYLASCSFGNDFAGPNWVDDEQGGGYWDNLCHACGAP